MWLPYWMRVSNRLCLYLIMSEQDSGLDVSQVPGFLKNTLQSQLCRVKLTIHVQRGCRKQCGELYEKSSHPERPLCRILMSTYSPPVNWSHHMIGDAIAEWVLKCWKANAFIFHSWKEPLAIIYPFPRQRSGFNASLAMLEMSWASKGTV
jgi:hypothetical protein